MAELRHEPLEEQKTPEELKKKEKMYDADFFDVHIQTPVGEQIKKHQERKKPGKSNAIYGFVFGLIAIIFWFSGTSAWFSVIFAAIGFLCTFLSKRAEYQNKTFLLIGFIAECVGALGGIVVYLISTFL